MNFKNIELNERYQLLTESDQYIDATGYKGRLTDIPRSEIIEGMISRKSNLVQLKTSQNLSEGQ